MHAAAPHDPRHTLQRASRLARPLTWGLGLGCALVVAPVAFLLVEGVAGLLVAGTLGLAGVQLAPVLAMKLAHLRLRLMQGEARGNPLLTLENLLLDRRTALTQASVQLQGALAQIDAFVDQANTFALRHPDAAPRWRERAQRAEQLREQKKRALRTAAESVAAFEQEVERARTEWALVEAERVLSQSLDATRGDPMALLMERTALDSVRLEMNRAFASLETALVTDLHALPPFPQTPAPATPQILTRSTQP
ncbi:hypothetical protein [Sphaerotilus sp.]|uniref:hypothetical protein n=1 Tax=Sphaerotilus sp. TaxID=2093942 RepID=UPI002ACD3D79|nr:hypothetical protein [Sphaerotilus sp.]MDZ7856798.1 hypothetical protein [Sphaerotilus sp.]